MASPALHLREVKTERVLRDKLDSPLSGQTQSELTSISTSLLML